MRILVLGRCDTVASILPARCVHDGVLTRGGPSASAFHVKRVVAPVDTVKSHLSPILAPGVADVPELLAGLLIGAPPDNRDDVSCESVVLGIGRGEDASFVFMERTSVHVARDRAARVDLFHHVVLPGDLAVLSDGSIGESIKLTAEAATRRERGASAAGVDSRACPVASAAYSLCALGGARRVLHASLVRDEASVLNELIRSGVRSSVTRASSVCPTVQDELNGEVDVNALSLAVNLDAVGKGG